MSKLTQELAHHVTEGTIEKQAARNRELVAAWERGFSAGQNQVTRAHDLSEYRRGYNAGHTAALLEVKDAEQRAAEQQREAEQASDVSQVEHALQTIDAILFPNNDDASAELHTITLGPAVDSPKTRYTLYVEEVDGVSYEDIVRDFYPGATIARNQTGLDARTVADDEYSVVITIITSAPDHAIRTLALAEALRSAANQASVLIVRDDVFTTEVVRL